MLTSFLTVVYALLTDSALVGVQCLALLGALRILWSRQASRLAATLPLRKLFSSFYAPPANFPALCDNLQHTYINLRTQCIDGKTLLLGLLRFETAAGQLAEAINPRTDIFEGTTVVKLLHEVSQKYRQLRLALGDYHREVDLRYHQVMHDIDGTLLSLRTSTGLSQSLESACAVTHKALDRTFSVLLSTHRTGIASVSQHRIYCWTVLHALQRAIADLQCFIAEKNPQLYPIYTEDILLNIWNALVRDATTPSANLPQIDSSLSSALSERQRTSLHILAGKPILDEASGCVNGLSDIKRQLENVPAYDVQVESIVHVMKVLREAWEQETSVPPQLDAEPEEAADIFMPLPSRSFDLRVQERTTKRTTAGPSPLKRHYSIA